MRKSIRLLFLIALTLVPQAAWAQSSASFRLSSHTLNNGGAPSNGVFPTSASHSIRLATIGETIRTLTIYSASFSMNTGFAASDQAAEVIFRDSFESADVIDLGLEIRKNEKTRKNKGVKRKKQDSQIQSKL